jgi:hypothetical protein
MTSEDLKAMRADLTAAMGPLAAANVFLAWERAIAERMDREAKTRSETEQNAMSGSEP